MFRAINNVLFTVLVNLIPWLSLILLSVLHELGIQICPRKLYFISSAICMPFYLLSFIIIILGRRVPFIPNRVRVNHPARRIVGFRIFYQILFIVLLCYSANLLPYHDISPKSDEWNLIQEKCQKLWWLSALTHLSLSAAVTYTFILILDLYRLLKDPFKSDKYDTWYHIVALLWSLIGIIFISSFDGWDWGLSMAQFCWIGISDVGPSVNWAMWITFYIPTGLGLLFCIIGLFYANHCKAHFPSWYKHDADFNIYKQCVIHVICLWIPLTCCLVSYVWCSKFFNGPCKIFSTSVLGMAVCAGAIIEAEILISLVDWVPRSPPPLLDINIRGRRTPLASLERILRQCPLPDIFDPMPTIMELWDSISTALTYHIQLVVQQICYDKNITSIEWSEIKNLMKDEWDPVMHQLVGMWIMEARKSGSLPSSATIKTIYAARKEVKIGNYLGYMRRDYITAVERTLYYIAASRGPCLPDFQPSPFLGSKKFVPVPGFPTAQYSDYGCDVFSAIHSLLGINSSEFARSVCQLDITEHGGGSSVKMLQTKDKKYLIKQITRKEHEVLLNMLWDYYSYLRSKKDGARTSLLAKILGCTAIKMHPHARNIYFKVMENAEYTYEYCYQYPMARFDLKGSWIDRDEHLFKPSSKRETLDPLLEPLNSCDSSHIGFNEVGKDLDFERYMNNNPQPPTTGVLIPANLVNDWLNVLKDDVIFLFEHNIMDYSLLVLIYPDPSISKCCIIDFLQTYTIKKKLETFVKSIISFHNPLSTNIGYSSVTPAVYSSRFIHNISRLLKGQKHQQSGYSPMEIEPTDYDNASSYFNFIEYTSRLRHSLTN
eukprot:NODE_561_length_2594_cov_22.002428_g482_i0.p1 GENE.NODE_561_length_2594_cov_22.002428_g482_i0~~NODE_561_length_2594_cov_22.002428_g482_i0.p1  ORF type:complete len:829 (-),score=96.48 NODE_561_length_2594_cov_22.002428_g482_i0:50-2536(-)